MQPSFEAIIKPIQVRGSGLLHEPGSNRITADGVSLTPMIWYAWQTDSFHTDVRVKDPMLFYRAVILVPKRRESVLFSTFQNALESTFGFQTKWIEEDRDVLVLKSAKALPASTADSDFEFRRGQIKLHKQTTAKLAEALPNWMQKPVIDETALPDKYDFDLTYRDDRPDVLISDLKSKYGLTLQPARRKIRMLVVESN